MNNNLSLWENAPLPPELINKLNSAIRRVRIIQILRGSLATLGVAIASVLAIMAIDAFIVIPSSSIRLIFSLSALALTLLTAFIALIRPLADPISPIRMARIIETRHPELQERISSALELLLLGGSSAAIGSSQLLNLLVSDARSDISAISTQNEFRGTTLKPIAISAAFFFSLFLLLLTIKPKQTALLFARAIAPTAPLNNLAARSFSVSPGNLTIVQGESVTFTLTAPNTDAPRAELLIERPGLPTTIERLSRTLPPPPPPPPEPEFTLSLDLTDDVPTPPPPPPPTPTISTYSVTLPNITSGFHYRFRINKALTRHHTITAIPPPAISSLSLSLTPPPYTGHPATQFVGSCEMPLRAPFGTRAALSASFNRPMSPTLHLAPSRTLSPISPSPANSASFSWSLSTNATSWFLSIQDASGFTNIPAPATYDPIPDFPPNVRLTYPSGNSYTLPSFSHLKMVFQITDDYGLSAARLQLQPDNEKIPWSSDLSFSQRSPSLWEINHEIPLGEYIMANTKMLRIWVEVEDNLPPSLGGPNISRSRTIAVKLDNAERRSLADQVRIPERTSITNLLESAALRLSAAAQKLAAATNAPHASLESTLQAALAEANAATSEALEKTAEASQTASEGLFAGVSPEIESLHEDSLQEVANALDEIPLTDEEQRAQAIRDAIDAMNNAIEQSRDVIPEILEKDAILEKASTLESLASQEEALAKKVQERQLTNQELSLWQSDQEQLANKFGALSEQRTPPPSPENNASPSTSPSTPPPASAPSSGTETPQKNDDLPVVEPTQQPSSSTTPTPASAAARAAELAAEARDLPKDESFLQSARTAESAARNAARAANESKHALSTKDAIEKDRPALNALAQAAQQTADNAQKILDDAFQIELQATKQLASNLPPNIARANAIAEKAEHLAALADLAAANPNAVSPEKLAALAEELSAEASSLAQSSDPFLKQVAEMAQNVANSLPTPPPSSESVASDNAPLYPKNDDLAVADPTQTHPAHQTENSTTPPPSATSQPPSPIAKAAEQARKNAELAAQSPHQQAANALAAASQSASNLSNLVATISSPNQSPASLDSLASATKQIAEQAQEAAQIAASAEQSARKQNSSLATQAAQKAKQTADATAKAAEALQKVLDSQDVSSPQLSSDASEDLSHPSATPPPSTPPLSLPPSLSPLLDSMNRLASDSAPLQEKLSSSPAEHAAEASQAAQKAASAAQALLDAFASTPSSTNSPSSPNAPDSALPSSPKDSPNSPSKPNLKDLIQEAKSSADAAREAAKSAAETARDLAQNFPAEAAAAAQAAANLSTQIANHIDQETASTPAFQPPSQPLLQNLASLTRQATNNAARAQHFATRAAQSPEEHINELNRELAKQIDSLSSLTQALSSRPKDAPDPALPQPPSQPSPADIRSQAQDVANNLRNLSNELPAINANAQRVAKSERALLTDLNRPDSFLSPAENALQESKELEQNIRKASEIANSLASAAQAAQNNNQNAAQAATERTQSLLNQLPPALSESEASNNAPSSLPSNLSPFAQAIADELEAANELSAQAQDALASGDAEQAKMVASEAASRASAAAKRASSSEAQRSASAERSSTIASQKSDEAQKTAQSLLNSLSSAPPSSTSSPTSTLTNALHKILDSASSPTNTHSAALANSALKDILALQAPSTTQLEAARQANLAAQELKRLAYETAELAGLDPETMKVKKPSNADSKPEKDPNRKKKPARTEVEGGGGANDDAIPEDNDDYEDGISLEMPEWLRRLGFPASEWLKYRGSLESGLPDSALESVPQEYRNLVREYFKLLATEK